MMRKKHLLKVFFLRIKWYFENISFALQHSKQVENYNFLVELREDAHAQYLELERLNHEHKDLPKLKIQIDLIDKILDYVKRP